MPMFLGFGPSAPCLMTPNLKETNNHLQMIWVKILRNIGLQLS